ncbi:MAG: MerR family transcriptional regulator [Lachnospiraceae bacterium]|nr:MerR family transcriptional regulator [Lachnospiraceae bacterium]
MSTKDNFKIGELSKIFNICVDSIRYYEKVGILNPTRNEENNYRYYSIEDFRRLALIREMLGLGFSTDKIKEFVTDRSIEKTKTSLVTELNAIDEQIKALEYSRKNLQHRLDSIYTMEERYSNEEIKEIEYGKRGGIMVKDGHIPDNMVDYYLIQYMNNNNHYIGTVCSCDCYTLDLPASNPESPYYRTKNVFFYSEKFTKKECNFFLPEGLYLSILYKGPLAKTKQLLPTMFDYAKEHNYEVVGDPIEFCYIDEYETNDENEYIIEIELPVSK